MPPTSLGTATAAKLFAGLLMASNPATASEIPRALEQQARPAQKTTSRLSRELVASHATTIVANDDEYDDDTGLAIQHERLTTQNEKLIGEIRSWSLLDADWDGEGAIAPSAQSIKEAVSFVRLIGDVALPEPMLLASGHIALYRNESDIYADIEFLGDGRIAYFIKRNGDKHKGVLSFDSQEMPAVFPALLSA